MIGSKAVTAIGIASVIHQIAIQTVDASTATPSGDNPSGFTNRLIMTKSSGPKTSPMRFVRFIQLKL